jgi:hypothetical protein
LLGGQLDRCLGGLDGFRESFRLGIGGGQGIQRLRVLAAGQFHRPLAQLDGLLRVSDRVDGAGGQGPGHEGPRPGRLIRFLLVQEHLAEALGDRRRLGIELQQGPQLGNGLSPLALVP